VAFAAQSGDKPATVEKSPHIATIGFAPHRVHDARMRPVIDEFITELRGFGLVGCGHDEAVQIADRLQPGPALRKLVSINVNRDAYGVDAMRLEILIEHHRGAHMRHRISNDRIQARGPGYHSQVHNYLVG
jgi:hypothetical protein